MFVRFAAGVLHGVPDHGVHHALLHHHRGQPVTRQQLVTGGPDQSEERIKDTGQSEVHKLLGALTQCEERIKCIDQRGIIF